MQKKYLYLLAAAHLCNDISSGALPAILPFFVSFYGMNYTDVAGIMFASCFLSSFIQPGFGYLADKTSFQWFMSIGVVMTSVSFAVTGFIDNYWLIFAAVTVMGIGAAVFHPEAARLVNSISGDQRGSGMSIFSIGGNGGYGLGPLLAVAVIEIFGMKGLVLFGIIGVFMGIILLRIVPKIKETATIMVEEREAADVAQHRFHEQAANDWNGFGRLTLVITFRSIVATALGSFLPLFCIQVMNVSNAVGSTTLSVFNLVGIVTTMIGGRLADRLGFVSVLRYGCIFMVPILIAAIMLQNIWVLFILLLPLSLTMHGTYSSFVVLGQSYLAKSIGFASGVTLGLSFSVGGVVVPFLGNYADTYGIMAVMILIIGFAAAMAASTLLLPEPKS
jgi:FSR family fosmidomycin resistance protein-like MFS transporter